jgi:hypothetical protein
VLENPRNRNFTKSIVWMVQSIWMGGVLSCPKQADASASGIITVIVVAFVLLIWLGLAIAPAIYHPVIALWRAKTADGLSIMHHHD